MESQIGPLSPTKKLKLSTSTLEIPDSKSDGTGSSANGVGTNSSPDIPVLNGLAPTRSGRNLSRPLIDVPNQNTVDNECSAPPENQEVNTQNSPNIQEEEVSSSENSVPNTRTPSYAEGDADFLANREANVSQDSEASAKNL